ncbi:MAG: hypothetical protein HYX61_02945 [Gammaproteobacteria bacterium]|jgi:hypothetical protein|nr:hypothetical protein [Gammaproteobacteria bacterium]
MTNNEDLSDERCEDEKSVLDTVTQDGYFTEGVGAVVQVEISEYFGKRNIKPTLKYLLSEVKKIKEGNLESAERMLIIQSHTLDAIFNNLAVRAYSKKNLYISETLFRLAFKAQSQCRMTLETLTNIKNPPQVAFVRQANIANNQQVNNNPSFPTSTHARAEKIKNEQNQLLEEHHGERLDIGTQGQTVKTDKNLGTVEKVHRAEKS